jgi:hypothetical protein
LVSGESKVHTFRWRDALRAVFQDVRIVQVDQIESLSTEDYVFSTPMDTFTLELVERFPAAKHIAISNALDMMDSNRFSKLVSNKSILERAFDIWVGHRLGCECDPQPRDKQGYETALGSNVTQSRTKKPAEEK